MLAYPAFLHSKFQSKIKEEKIMVEMLCKDVVMHFNKKHLENSECFRYLQGEEYNALGHKRVSPCSTRFLVIVGQALWHGIMNHISDIGFVDTHAKRDSTTEQFQVSFGPTTLTVFFLVWPNICVEEGNLVLHRR